MKEAVQISDGNGSDGGRLGFLMVISLLLVSAAASAGEERGRLLYQNNLSTPEDVAGWVMEGEAQVSFRDGWMEMKSPEQRSHHVFWCPEEFPDRFVAEWEAQNLNPEAGLCIVFLAARGLNGEDIFDPSLPKRDGDFRWYIKDRLRSYHISYYANTPEKPDRPSANLRKNNEFNLVQEGAHGIPTHSTAVHQIRLVKDGGHIQLSVDGRKAIDWTDTEANETRPPYGEGKLGFRQMQWTHFRYRNLRVWEILDHAEALEGMANLPVIHPKRRLWAEPAFDAVVEQNPPILEWPPVLGEGIRYEVRLSRDPRFPDGAETVRGSQLKWSLFHPGRLLEAGRWHWQYRVEGGAWSARQTFVVSAASVAWNPPATAAFLSSVPSYRPRVLVDEPRWATFRAQAKDTREYARIVAEADRVLKRKIPSEQNDILSIVGEDAKKTDKLRKDASQVIGQALYAGIGPLCKAYVLTRNPVYADAAIQWALEGATWDPDGVTRISDFGDSRIMLALALVYDSMNEFLEAGQRKTLREAIAARAGNFYADYVNNKESAVLSNHVWQHIFHYFFDTAIAMQGEVPEAEEWLAYLYEMFLARAPILGGRDGGWVHGLAYFRMNMETLVDVPRRIQDYTGFDFIQHTPWYHENAYYFLYGFPPGSAGTGFADNAHDLPEPRGPYLAYADALSRLVQNPHAAWYRDRVGQVASDLKPHLQAYWRSDYVLDEGIQTQLGDTDMLQWYRLKYLYALPPAPPVAPSDLPRARLFRDVGLVTMHSQPLDRPAEGNLYLAMRASPFGTYSHMLSDNNTFNLVYGGDRLFYHTGYKVAMSAPHRQLYYKHTKSHNGILINGEGQPYQTEAYAWFENFLTGEALSYAVGNASNAYDSVTEREDHGLERFRRHVVMLRPDMVVVYDELVAEEPAEWSYLLHSYNEIRAREDAHQLSTHNRAGRAMVHLYSSAAMDWTVTDEYEVPAENWRGIEDEEGELIEYTNNAWHFAAKTERARAARFLAFIQVRPQGETEDWEFNEIRPLPDGGYRIGKWRVRAEMDPEKKARVEIVNTIDGVAFTSSGPLDMGPGLGRYAGAADTAKLAERQGEQTVLMEGKRQVPRKARAAQKYFEASREGALE